MSSPKDIAQFKSTPAYKRLVEEDNARFSERLKSESKFLQFLQALGEAKPGRGGR